MEVAEAKDNSLHLVVLVLKLVLVEESEGTQQIVLHALRWLIRDLDALLQETNRDVGACL